MQMFHLAAVAGLAYFAIGATASSVFREPVHLRAAPDSVDEPWKAALQASISNFAVPTPKIAVNAAAQTKGVTADKEDKDSVKSKLDQPVQVQVPDTEMNAFIGTLSTGCGGRFQQMLKGEGGDLHTFGTHGAKANEASCSKLQGTLCETQAHIIHEKKTTSNGRKMESTMDVAGNSCLPKQCMSKADLDQLSQFMHTQAKNIIPGAEHRVELLVDCSKNGGASSQVGVPKSGSSSSAPMAMVLALALASARFACF